MLHFFSLIHIKIRIIPIILQILKIIKIKVLGKSLLIIVRVNESEAPMIQQIQTSKKVS